MEITSLWQHVPTGALNFAVRTKPLRNKLMKIADEKIYNKFVVQNAEKWPVGVQEGRYRMLMNLFHALNKAISDGRLSSKVSKAIIGNFVTRTLLGQQERVAHFNREYNMYPPGFLTISPTKRCNLFCTGCYASSSAGDAETLRYDILNRIIKDKQQSWGSYFTVISGGEPLLYRDGKKTFFDFLEDNQNDYFMMYTNGTLITKDVARKMADLGNVTPAISVEGFEKETDERRGKGVYAKIMRAMDNLKEAGVPFGVSATATRKNVDKIMSDKFIDFYFKQAGAIYGWIFQYMPIGRSYTTDLMISPDQRLELFKREEKMIKESNIFLVDFWNGGPYTVGCISAGRPGGYFYIDWNGNAAPCAFYPYFTSNLYNVYKENKTLNDVLFSPYFKSIRSWQTDYGFNQPPEKVKNYIVPCIMRDHFDNAFSIVNKHHAKPMDVNAELALADDVYQERMREYGKDANELTQEYWEKIFKKDSASAGKEKAKGEMSE